MNNTLYLAKAGGYSPLHSAKGGRVGVSPCLPTLCKGGQRRRDFGHGLIDERAVTL